MQKVHIIGIGGSAASGIAQIAQAQGYNVTGCDAASDTPYIEKAKKAGIEVHVGHSASHITDADVVAVSPALMYQNIDHPEIVDAKDSGRLVTWQAFMSQYLHKGKYVMCVTGTHGKSTTTALLGLVLEAAGKDPTVQVGATVPNWQNNIRIGHGEEFVTEADEFNDNFLNYHPDVIIINNIEMDHPEYFHTEERLLQSFQKFVDNLKPNGIVIYNADSPLIHKLRLPDTATPYTFSEYDADVFPLSIPGDHNKANALGVITLARLLQIPDETTATVLKDFTGLERRIQLLGEKRGVKVYDDYANLPTAFAASIAGVKELHPDARVWAIIEPHTFSRLRVALPDLPNAVAKADHVVVSKVFASREQDPRDFSGKDIAHAMYHPDARYIPEFDDITKVVAHEAQPGDVILVMGSGDSYKLSRRILAALG